MNSELETFLRREVAQRNPVNLPAGIGGVPAGAEIHIHYHAAPDAVPAADPALRSTRDDGVLAWFMPYFVIGMLAFILTGAVVGLIMLLLTTIMAMVVTLMEALAATLVVVVLAVGAAALLGGSAVEKVRGKGSAST